METSLKPHIERQLFISNIPDELQFGFRKGYSCSLTSLSLELLIEINSLCNRPTYLALLEAEKAFDTVWHGGLFYKLGLSKLDSDIQNMLLSMYQGLESRVFWKGKVSDQIRVTQGVRQGGVLSPTLYTVFVDGLIKVMREKNLGCSVGGRFSGIIVLADDVALICNSSLELQQMLETTFDYVRQWQYRINPSKSAVIVSSKKKQPSNSSWEVDGATIDEKVSHPHLGILKSGIRLDPTGDIIGTGTRTFFALTGTGAYTGGLVPTLVSQLWKTFCIPRMLHGSSIHKFTKSMLLKLDRAQSHLFKQVLGVPKTAADEIVYLLTDLLPVSSQIDLRKLLLLGQLVNLDHTRFEFRTFLDALNLGAPTIRLLQEITKKYDLPDLHSLLSNPPVYSSWKRLVNYKVNLLTKHNTCQGILSKPSLKYWQDCIPPSAKLLYPKSVLSPVLRRAFVVRAQLLTATYLTQCRLFTLKKSTSRTCPLCKSADETVEHFTGQCPKLDHLRQVFIGKVKDCLVDFPTCVDPYVNANPQDFTQATLIPFHSCLPKELHNSLLLLSLFFLHKIDVFRTDTVQTS
nr:uncharacterized protein LOC129267399 [Lytechinus pictus]